MSCAEVRYKNWHRTDVMQREPVSERERERVREREREREREGQDMEEDTQKEVVQNREGKVDDYPQPESVGGTKRVAACLRFDVQLEKYNCQ